MSSLQLNQGGAQLLDLPTGQIEVLVDLPAQPARGTAIIAHPQPLLGGSATHKLPQFIAHALRETGWITLRPNFRGVGRSSGAYNHGTGEAEDLFWLQQQLRHFSGGAPLALLGVSFGAFVQAQVAARLQASGQAAQHTVLAAMPYGEVPDRQRRYDTPDAVGRPLVIHGERDESVPLASVLDWARPRGHAVVVLPGASHLFTGKLPALRELILAHLRP